jgi:hypothetical protein
MWTSNIEDTIKELDSLRYTINQLHSDKNKEHEEDIELAYKAVESAIQEIETLKDLGIEFNS